MKRILLLLPVILFLSCQKSDDLPEIIPPEHSSVTEAEFRQTILLEPMTSVSCGACPLMHAEVSKLEEDIEDVVHISHYLFGPLHHEYTDFLIESIDKTFYTPMAHIQRNAGTEGIVYYTTGNLQSDVQNIRAEMAQIRIDVSVEENNDQGEVTIALEANEAYDLTKVRLTVFVVEKKVVGVGQGYDQRNYGNDDPDHPYFMQGAYIEGFEHSQVLRAVLTDFEGESIDISDGSAKWKGMLTPSGLSDSLQDYQVIAMITSESKPLGPVLNVGVGAL